MLAIAYTLFDNGFTNLLLFKEQLHQANQFLSTLFNFDFELRLDAWQVVRPSEPLTTQLAIKFLKFLPHLCATPHRL
jgi:hypothetical protein